TLSARPDFATLAEVVPLSEEAIDWAMGLCRTIMDGEEQWRSYLRSLALIGAKQWLEDGTTPYEIQLDQQHPDQPMVLQVNGLQMGVVPIGSLPPDTVLLPQAKVEGTQATVGLWLLVEVQEELGQVRVVQALENQQVVSQARLQTVEGDYRVPLTAFTLSPDRTLFYLSYLPQALEQSAVQTRALETPTQPAPPATESVRAAPLRTQVMNVGRWLQDQLDEVAQQFAWTLLDPLTPAAALRSPTQELETILSEIEPQGVTIPQRARAAYTEVQVAGMPLRLYVLAWNVFEGGTPEWSLLVFLGPVPGDQLPSGLALRICDADSVLTQQTFFAGSESTFLFAQVFGTWDESFTLEIMPPDGGAPLVLPAFGFQPTS
ncbi:MAG: DUF1822 family protein, partial [Cyanobacteria bacterium J06636_16]